MSLLFNDPLYAPLWTGNIARGLLDYIYSSQLSEVQRKLLLAFSVYREPAALDAAQAIVPDAPKAQILPTLTVLLNQHLLNAVGDGLYQLHAIVNSYAQEHFDESSEEANQAAVVAAHARAAQYYLQRAAKICPPRENRRAIRDVQPLIEAVWHYCRAEQWQEAYNLMVDESIFTDVERWGGNAILLELYQLLLSDQWQPQPAQSADIYDCLGRLYDTVGKRSEALACYEQALSICREVGDRYGEGVTLWNIGACYFEQVRYAAALACFLVARGIFEEVQSPNRDDVQRWIDDLRKKIGERKFAALLAEVEPRALQRVEEALVEGL